MNGLNKIIFFIISITILLSIIFYPKVVVREEAVFIKSPNSCRTPAWWEGDYTHLVQGQLGSKLYAVGHNSGDIFIYYGKGTYRDYSDEKVSYKIVKAPKQLNDVFIDDVYMTDRYVYVVGSNGHMYGVDMEYLRIIYILNLRRMINESLYGDYHILWANLRGYSYILINHTIFHLYLDEMVLDKWSFNFTGYYLNSYFWEGGFIIMFGTSQNSFNAYYVKNGSIQWSIEFSKNYYFSDGYLYLFKDNLLQVYRDGKKIGEKNFEGPLMGVRRINNFTYIGVCSTTKNYLVVLDNAFDLYKKVELFDMAKIGIYCCNSRGQRIQIYANNSGYHVLLYTAEFSHKYPFIPLRVIHLNTRLEVLDAISVYISRPIFIKIYPLDNCYVGITSGWKSIYVFKIENVTHINFLAWKDYKLLLSFIAIIILEELYYSYAKWEKLREKLKQEPPGGFEPPTC